MLAAVNSRLTWNPGLQDFRFPVVAEVYRYWAERRGQRSMPGRADIDPLAMRGALGNIALIEVHRDPLRFRIRLAGTYQAERLGMDPTGLWLEDLPAPEYRDLLLGRLHQVVARPQPLLAHNRQMMDNRWYDYEALWLPLGTEDSVDMVLACQIFADAPQGG